MSGGSGGSGVTRVPTVPLPVLPVAPGVVTAGWQAVWCGMWGRGYVPWVGTNRYVYSNGVYAQPRFEPAPMGGVVYLTDPNLLPGRGREAVQAPPPPPPTASEVGAALLRSRRWSEAATHYESMVRADAEDWESARLLAVSLVGSSTMPAAPA